MKLLPEPTTPASGEVALAGGWVSFDAGMLTYGSAVISIPPGEKPPLAFIVCSMWLADMSTSRSIGGPKMTDPDIADLTANQDNSAMSVKVNISQ